MIEIHHLGLGLANDFLGTSAGEEAVASSHDDI
jgi:hypothetical protein